MQKLRFCTMPAAPCRRVGRTPSVFPLSDRLGTNPFNPNGVLRFMCEVINHLLRHTLTLVDQPAHPGYRHLGDANVAAHRRLLAAARRGNTGKVRKLMVEHVDETGRLVLELSATVRERFVTDSDLQPRFVPERRKP